MCEDYLNCVSVTEREEPDAGKWLEVQVALNPDGSVTVRNTFDNEPVGGHPKVLETVHKTLEPLHIPVKKIYMRLYDASDTEDARLQALCGAVEKACRRLLETMRRIDGSYRSYAEMVQANLEASASFRVNEEESYGAREF